MDSETEKLKEIYTAGGRSRRARSCTIRKEPAEPSESTPKEKTSKTPVKKLTKKPLKKSPAKTVKTAKKRAASTSRATPSKKVKKTPSKTKVPKEQKKTIEYIDKMPSSESELSDLENSEDEWKNPDNDKRARKISSSSSSSATEATEDDIIKSIETIVEARKAPKRRKLVKKATPKKRQIVESEEDESEPEAALATSREMNDEWNDVEVNQLAEALESMRKKGHTLGIYGLNEQQATWIHKQHLPTKSIRQIKRIVFANVNEHVLTTDQEPIDAWRDLFDFLYSPESKKKSKEAFNAYLQDRARYHRLEAVKRKKNDSGIEQPNLETIYKYLGAILMNEDEQPNLADADVICLLNALENIEKQAAVLSSKELSDVLNARYAALLGNRKKMTSLRDDRALLTEENGNFDPNNPLALNIGEWKDKFNEELKKDYCRHLFFGNSDEIVME